MTFLLKPSLSMQVYYHFVLNRGKMLSQHIIRILITSCNFHSIKVLTVKSGMVKSPSQNH